MSLQENAYAMILVNTRFFFFEKDSSDKVNLADRIMMFDKKIIFSLLVPYVFFLIKKTLQRRTPNIYRF